MGGGDLQALIRVKERELHEIHDMRCGQLEKLVEERDGLLMASHNRFEQLKEDFRYNLTLLEARDAELARLEMLVEQKEGALLEIEAERRALAGRLEVLELRDADRIEKHNQDKATSKVKMGARGTAFYSHTGPLRYTMNSYSPNINTKITLSNYSAFCKSSRT